MTAISGSNAYIEFYKGDDYYPVGCEGNLTYTTTTETKNVRTLGDGHWAKFRGQSLSYTISVTSLVPYPIIDPTRVSAFDLIEDQMGFIDTDFRIIFEDNSDTLLKVITGRALVINSTLTAGAADFLEANFELIGQGAPAIGTALSDCSATIGNVTFTGEGIGSIDEIPVNFSYTGLSGATRFEFSIDGGGRQAVLDADPAGTFEGVVPNTGGNVSHEIIVYPICSNGSDGVPFELTFSAG